MNILFHPASEIFPLLNSAELATLAGDIEANGLLEAIVLHTDGSILDGRNRYLACLKVDVEPRFVEWDCKGTEEQFVDTMNFHRRHLSTKARKERAVMLAKQNPDMSARAIARATYLDHHTVIDVISPDESNKDNGIDTTGEIPHPASDKPKSLKTGNRIDTPDDQTIEQMVRNGMALGLNNADTAKRIGVGHQAYSQLRDMVLLLDKDELSPKHKDMVSAAWAKVNETKQNAEAYEDLDSITARVWGPKQSRGPSREKTASNRQGKFEVAYASVVSMCRVAEQIDIPYLSVERTGELSNDLKRAEASIRKFRQQLEEIHA